MRIVEFGPSTLPVFKLSKSVEEKIKSGATYIGIEIGNHYGYIHPEMRNRLISGDLGRIPLREEVADEIWLINVFSGGIVNPPERFADGTLKYELGLDRHFKEMSRILKPGGKIYIGEWYSRIAHVDWLKTSNYQEYGLARQVYEEESFYEFVKQHELYTWPIHDDVPPFFVCLTKSSEVISSDIVAQGLHQNL